MWRPPVSIPLPLEKTYRMARAILWIFVLIIGYVSLTAFLFPDFTYSFSFRNPQSSRNTLLDPRLPDGLARTNGKIAPAETLLLNAGVAGDYSDAAVTAVLENKSELTESLRASLRRSYRAFLFPEGPPLAGFPDDTLYRVDETYYALRDGQLFPFVSESAFLSRYPASSAAGADRNLFERYPRSEEFIGFRVGSLLSFADGVFVVTSDHDIRPVGSAEIFLALGYRFEDVLPVSEEDIGIYKRGRIIQLGFTHPTGTLFADRENGTVFMISDGMKRVVTDPALRDFLLSKQHPIEASASAATLSAECMLTPGLFARTLACGMPIGILQNAPGSDLELSLTSPEAPIDIATLTLRLETRRNEGNALRLLSQLKQRVLKRFGGNE